jgi:hypothetical protein
MWTHIQGLRMRAAVSSNSFTKWVCIASFQHLYGSVGRIPALSPRCASFVGPHSRFACVGASWCNHWVAKIIADFYFRKAIFLRKFRRTVWQPNFFLMNYVSRSYKLSILYFFMNFRSKLRKLSFFSFSTFYSRLTFVTFLQLKDSCWKLAICFPLGLPHPKNS